MPKVWNVDTVCAVHVVSSQFCVPLFHISAESFVYFEDLHITCHVTGLQ